jgi:hypothetical protein
MLGRSTSEISLRFVGWCAWFLAPLACARGIDSPLDEPANDAAPPITVGAGASSTVGGGFAGTSTTSTVATSAGGEGGGAGRGSVTSGGAGSSGTSGSGGSGGSSGGASGNGGAAGNSGAGGAGVGGSSGMGGGAGSTPEPRPTAISLSQASVPSGQKAASAGGSAFRQSCAANEVIIGYTGTIDAPDAAMSQLRTFQAVCASLSVSGTTKFVVTTTTKELLPVVGTMPGATQQTELCPNDQVVVGFAGRSGSDIDQIVTLCAPLTISGSTPNYALTLGAETARPPVGGPGGQPFAAIRCPAGQVATGDEGRAAFTINAFGLLCATPSLVVQ